MVRCYRTHGTMLVARSCEQLNKEFAVKDVEKVLNVSKRAAESHIYRWKSSGYVEQIKRGAYRKILNEIM